MYLNKIFYNKFMKIKFKFLIFLSSFLTLNAIEPIDNNIVNDIRSKIENKSIRDLSFISQSISKKIPESIHHMDVQTGTMIEGDNKILMPGFLSPKYIGKENTMNIFKEEIFNIRNKYLYFINEDQRKFFCSNPYTYILMEKGIIFSFQYRMNDFALFAITETTIEDCNKKRIIEDIPNNLLGAGRYEINSKEKILKQRKKL